VTHDREEIRDCIEVLESKAYAVALERIFDKQRIKTKSLIADRVDSDRNRGWIEAFDWIARMPADMRKEIKDEINEGSSTQSDDV